MKKKILLSFFLFLVLFVSIFLLVTKKKEIEVVGETLPIQKEEKKEEKEEIAFDIKGAVQNPGVYKVGKGVRVQDAIEKSGGLTENADTQFINLSKTVVNEMVIIIYTKEEIASMTEGNLTIRYIDKECICPSITNEACIDENKETNQKKEETEIGIININTAPKEKLLLLPGIGEAKAEAILSYRKETPFQKIEDIQNVKGIGEALFAKLAPYITV